MMSTHLLIGMCEKGNTVMKRDRKKSSYSLTVLLWVVSGWMKIPQPWKMCIFALIRKLAIRGVLLIADMLSRDN